MHEHVFEYVTVRVVPRVERGEFLNAGVILVCRPKRFLDARVGLSRDRLQALAPWLDRVAIDEIAAQVDLVPAIARGEAGSGPIAALGMGERWHWLAAPASTIIQPGVVHTGLCDDPAAELDRLYHSLVETA